MTLKDETYEISCPVDGHKDLGMKTEITVAGAPVNTIPSTPTSPPPPGNGY
ncbi:hypothetical protein [Streptomyces sp. NPDC056431]|uniref:hypothetical protein n=1 Tax=Streptomyces sp. NPDC056431 TaxID=3345814 RepID=UPI00369444FD